MPIAKLALVPLVMLTALGCQAGEARTGSPPTPAPTSAPHTVPATALRTIAEPAPALHDAAPPWTLTASDGSGLQLTRVDAKAVVEGPLAFTELHLYFHNPEDRIREGTFAITLPTDAAVSRFAMEINGRFQEAEVIDKTLARRVYEDFLHRKQDPALLEKGAGNQFTARVFPIPAKGDKHLVLSFSQELAGRGYALPLRGLPKIERVDVELTATQADGTTTPQVLSKRNWRPEHDFVGEAVPSAAAVTSGALVVGAVAFTAANATFAQPEPLHTVTLLVDTSASRALGFASYVRSIRALIAELRTRYGDALPLQVLAFDQDSQRIFAGSAAAYGDAEDKALIDRGAAGASDIAQAIATLAAGPVHRRVIVITDGVVTAGPDTPAVVAAINRLPIDRLDVVLAGGIRDERLAASLVRARLPRAGDVFDLDRGVADVATGLGEPVYVDVPVEVPGADWSYPKHIASARPGSTVMVYARMAKPTRSLQLVIGGARQTLALGRSTPALTERAVASAEIAELETTLASTTDPTAAAAMRADIAQRSVRARVISSQTSMLVLETEWDYQRYNIARTSLANILVIGPKGIEQTKRAKIIATRPRTLTREQAIEQARASGILGAGTFASLTGSADFSSGFDDRKIYGGLLGDQVGEMQGGRGFGVGGGSTSYGAVGHGARGQLRMRVAAAPAVSIGQPTVQGDLDKSFIKRYIRRQFNKLTYCYERELLAKPTLAGIVTTRFVIDSTGTVLEASATGVDDTVARCVAGVIADIEFPAAHGGGIIIVNYPITFVRAGEPRPAPDPVAAAIAAPAPVVPEPAPAIVAAPTPQVATRDDARPARKPALTGKLAEVMKALRLHRIDQAFEIANAWHADAPGDVLALIALGEALEAKQDLRQAARIYGSIIDLYPMRADFRRFAGQRLERIGDAARPLVIDTYRRAVADRPDHVTGHRLLAYALVRAGDHAGALDAILAGIDHKYPAGRFRGADRVLADDAGMIAATYLAHGGTKADITKRLAKRSLSIATRRSTRFVLYWETDANDVDFHIEDNAGGHASYQQMQLPSGGELYADVTTGYGPECFAIQGTPKSGPYRLSLNYYAQGPMGYGMGLLQIQRFDGTNLTFEDRPYVIMVDQAFIDLGTYR